MMIPIKIQCGCGQRYAFDVEPVRGRMPSAVACPVCGADGTAAANEVIARSLSAQSGAAGAPGGAVKLRAAVSQPTVHRIASAPSAPAVAPRGGARLPGQIERSQAEHEARAKILWGDAPGDVTRYLIIQGFSAEEASSLVQAMFQERAATIRSNGIKKMVTGAGLMCVPVVAFFIFMSMAIFPVRIFAFTLMIGCWGGWMALKGAIMFFAPKSEPGDVAEQ